jgi:hypothetical protein
MLLPLNARSQQQHFFLLASPLMMSFSLPFVNPSLLCVPLTVFIHHCMYAVFTSSTWVSLETQTQCSRYSTSTEGTDLSYCA